MSKQDPYRFNLRFDETDEDHQKVCAFLNACGRKKTRYIVKAFQAYWGKGSADASKQPQEITPTVERERQQEITEDAEKKQMKEDTEHFVSIDEDDYSADQAEVSLMMRNYQMFDSLGKET